MPKLPVSDARRRSPRPSQAKVLVVDDEPTVLAGVRRLLETFGMAVWTAESTAEALRTAALLQLDVALIDWRLGPQDDGMALGRALRRDYGIPFVIFSAYLDTSATSHAHRLGAAAVVDKPLQPTTLQAALQWALRSGSRSYKRGIDTPEAEVGSSPVVRRWAELVLRACRAPRDPNTEPVIAQAGGVSVSGFCKICDACGVEPRATRDLSRFLRALSRSKEDGSMLRIHLATSDPRTRERLFERAGLSTNSRFVPLRRFLLHQKFIPTTRECLRELTHLAANDPLFFFEFDSDHKDTPTRRLV